MGTSKLGTPQTEEEKLQAQMADFEFEIEVDKQLGPVGRSELSASSARFGPSNYSAYGQEGLFLPSVSSVDSEGRTIRQEVRVLRGVNIPENVDREHIGSLAIQESILGELPEEGTVTAFGASNATPFLWAHEFRHKERGGDEDERRNRLWDAFRADSPSEWKRAVNQWFEIVNVGGKLDAEDALLEALENNKETLLNLEARASLEQGFAVPNRPSNLLDEVSLLEAHKKFSEDSFDTRQRLTEAGLKNTDPERSVIKAKKFLSQFTKTDIK